MTSPPTAPNDYSAPRTQEECDALDHGRVMIQMYLDPKAVTFSYSWGWWKIEDYRDLRTGKVNKRVRTASFDNHEKALDYIGRLIEDRKLIGVQPMNPAESAVYSRIEDRLTRLSDDFLGVPKIAYDGVRGLTPSGRPRRPFSVGKFWFSNDFGNYQSTWGSDGSYKYSFEPNYYFKERTFSTVEGMEKFVNKLPKILPPRKDFDMYHDESMARDIRAATQQIRLLHSHGNTKYCFPFPQLRTDHSGPILRYEREIYKHRDPVIERMAKTLDKVQQMLASGCTHQLPFVTLHRS